MVAKLCGIPIFGLMLVLFACANPNPVQRNALQTESTIPPSTASPSVLPTNGSNNSGQLSIPIGIGVVTPEVLAIWNTYALESDMVSVSFRQPDFLNSARTKNKSIVYLELSATNDALHLAQQHGANTVGFNLETTNDCTELIRQEQAAYQQVKPTGIRLVFGPTGRMLTRCIASNPEIAQQADILVFQTQGLQMQDNYAEEVMATVHAIRSVNPQVGIWAQVSVNPPGSRTVTAEEVIQSIRSIQSSVDSISIFIHPTPDRLVVLEQVLKTLR